MSPSQKINKLNQELILDKIDLLQLALCDNKEIDYLINIMKNHPLLKKPTRKESYDFDKVDLVEVEN